MLVLWSINKWLSRKNMLSYQERVQLIQKIYPWLPIQGIPDYPTDEEWIFALDQMIRARYTGDMKNVIFYWWCEEDIAYLAERGRTCKIINRFDGISSIKISATEIRDILLRWEVLHDHEWTKKALSWYINPLIQDELITLFGQKLVALKKF